MVPFGGWEMPLSYPLGTIGEHRACRHGTALFDVSHLGTVRVEGQGAFDALQAAFTNDLGRIGPGRAQYTHLLDPDDASVLDDIIVWWIDPERFDVMPNASNTERVSAALQSAAATVRDVTTERALLAVQGPGARRLLEVVAPDAAEVGRFRVAEVEWRGTQLLVAGTGYTGEDGVELAVPVVQARTLWDELCDAGAVPAGLGARDTLRLEAGLPLHGHELGPGITPLQAGLGWVVSWDKGDFIGREVLAAEREGGVTRKIVGLATEGRRPPREGSDVVTVDGSAEPRRVGTVTSGNFSPELGHGIALALVGSGVGEADHLAVDVRGTLLPARVVPRPFVKRPTPA